MANRIKYVLPNNDKIFIFPIAYYLAIKWEAMGEDDRCECILSIFGGGIKSIPVHQHIAVVKLSPHDRVLLILASLCNSLAHKMEKFFGSDLTVLIRICSTPQPPEQISGKETIHHKRAFNGSFSASGGQEQQDF